MATTGGSIQTGAPVEVYVAANDLEAQVIKTFLESNDIPVMLQGDAVSKIYGLAVGGLAEVRVFVPEALAAKAVELLEEAEESDEDAGAEEADEPS
jgi:hypothetical protein